MSDVTGPISTLPGARHKVPVGTMCDDHPDRLAVMRIQGETDSMGSEMHDMCQECVHKYEQALMNAEPELNSCDWCKSLSVLSPRRDYDEGSCGPVYYVCRQCIQKQAEYYKEYYEVYEGYWD